MQVLWGAAILGAAADESITGYKDANEAAAALGKINEEVYVPNPENVRVYEQLYTMKIELFLHINRNNSCQIQKLSV